MSIELSPSKDYPGRIDLTHKHSPSANMQTRLALTREDLKELVVAAQQLLGPKVEEPEELTVYGYIVVGRDGGLVKDFTGEDQTAAIKFAAESTQDCKDMGIDWDYRVAAIVDQGGL